MRNYFEFNGEDSRDYGVYISGGGTYDSPERRYQNISVPGRDGDLLSTETRLENVDLEYPAFIYDSMSANLADLRSKFLSIIGYARLEDTYHDDEYRLAVYKGGLSADVLANHTAASFPIRFECKPQRYLKSGEIAVAITSGDTITNPTPFASRPLIRVEGDGTLEIGDVTVTIAPHSFAYIDIDSEMMDCYSGANNCNSYVSFSGNDFPLLPSGATGIIYDVSITGVTITPKWWRV